MSNLTRALMMGAAGAASGDPVYVDDVFNTFLYSPSATQTQIQSGIDFSGEGGMIWKKSRTSATSNHLYDTERGNTKTIYSDLTNGEGTSTTDLLSFNSNGVTWDTGGHSGDYVNWSFRKQKGFFDVVTYTGNGTAGRTVAHNLGSVPGMIIVKKTSDTGNWMVYHRSIGNGNGLYLNGTSYATSGAARWNSTDPTSTHFTVDNHSDVNTNSDTYVAYVFAHDDQSFGTDRDESIIKCGTVVTNGSPQEINLGFEPQFLILKKSSTSGSWYMIDTMRGFTASENPVTLKTDSADAEGGLANWRITNTGIKFDDADNGTTWIYMAIRRPHKPPSAGTEVFKAITRNGTQADVSITGFGFVPDLFMGRARNNVADQQWQVFDRLRAPLIKLNTRYNSVESSTANSLTSFDQDGVSMGSDTTSGGINYTGGQYVYHIFSRAPGFFDTVTYTGSGASRNITHNLDATPGMIWIKRRTGGNGNWTIWSGELSSSTILQFTGNPTNPEISVGTSYINSATSTTFNVGTDSDVNANTSTYIAYLFGSLNGISKVGSYSGTGNDINVDCGFTAGARYVLIKRKTGANPAGGWYVWDTTRGIVSGDDPYLFINGSAIEVTNTDYIDPLNSGFTVTSSAPAEINASGSTYLFFAIA